MNILLTFSDNRFPKLDNNNFYNIILKNYKNVLEKTEADTYNYGKDNLLLRCYTENLSQEGITNSGFGNDIIYYEKRMINIRQLNTALLYRNYRKYTHIVYYDDIDYIEKKDNARDVYIDDKLKENIYFKFVSPLIPISKLENDEYFPKNGQSLLRYYDKHKKNYITYKDIHNLKIQSDNPPITNKDNLKISDKYETILKKYQVDNYYDQFYMINSIRIGHFTKTNKVIYNLIFDTLFSYMK